VRELNVFVLIAILFRVEPERWGKYVYLTASSCSPYPSLVNEIGSFNILDFSFMLIWGFRNERGKNFAPISLLIQNIQN
jgi:hypothetical protein